jgi:hypothetical protein
VRIFAIDPGTNESAYVLYDAPCIHLYSIVSNANMLHALATLRADLLAIEWVSFYGKEIHAGSETFDTCRWVGRFEQAWGNDAASILIPRRKVRQELCGTMKAGDAEVRAVLIDRYGGKEKAIGKKAHPGPLYGISSHVWSALAVAVIASEQKKAPAQIVDDADIPF